MGVADWAENKHCREQPLQDVRAGLSVKPSEENLYPYILMDYPPVSSYSMLYSEVVSPMVTIGLRCPKMAHRYMRLPSM